MAESEAETEPKKGGKKKLLLIAVLAVLLLGGGGGAAAFFLGGFSPGDSKAETEDGYDETTDDKASYKADADEKEMMSHPVFIDIPDVVVNLTADGSRMRFLKLKVTLEVEGEQEAENIARLMPRLLDSFQLYLRALTIEELQGPQGLQLIKEELAARANLAVRPHQISDLLIKEMLVQ